jgi:hypothetical protein
MAMPASEVHEFARQLFAARGNSAIVEAAQKAVAFEKQNNSEEAEDWRRIEKALKLMQGPHSS